MHRGGQNTIVRVDILWVGGKNPKDMGNNIIYRGVKIPWVGGQITMYGGSKYHEWGGGYTMGRRFHIP
jgi:hypothetical protein